MKEPLHLRLLEKLKRNISSTPLPNTEDEFDTRGKAGAWIDETLGHQNYIYLAPPIKRRLIDWYVLYSIVMNDEDRCKDEFEQYVQDKSVLLFPLCIIFEQFLKQLFKDIKLTNSIEAPLFETLHDTNVKQFEAKILRTFNEKEKKTVLQKLKEIKTTLQDYRHIYLHGANDQIERTKALSNKCHSILSHMVSAITFFREKGLIKKPMTKKETKHYLYGLKIDQEKKNFVEKTIGKITKRDKLNWSDVLGNSKVSEHVRARKEICVQLKERGIPVNIIAELMGNRGPGNIYNLIRSYENNT